MDGIPPQHLRQAVCASLGGVPSRHTGICKYALATLTAFVSWSPASAVLEGVHALQVADYVPGTWPDHVARIAAERLSSALGECSPAHIVCDESCMRVRLRPGLTALLSHSQRCIL